MDDRSDKNLMIVDDGSTGFSRWLPALVVFAVVAGFVALAWYAYHAGMQSLKNDDLLVVEPEKTPVKEKPSNPGGMQFPDQDKTIFDTFGGNPPPQAKVERVLPPPEQPAVPPADNSGTTGWINKNLPSPAGSEQIIAPAQPAPAPEKKAEEKPVPQVVAAPPSPEPAAAPAPKIVETRPEPAPVVTPAPAETAKPAPKPEKKKPLPPAYSGDVSIAGPQVQLGAYRSEEEAMADWKHMQKKHALLADKEPVILKADLGKRGIYYRLRLGGFKSHDDAESFCRRLTAAHQPCMVPVK